MTDDLDPTDPLARAAQLLRTGVPVPDGLPARVAARRRRGERRRALAIGGGGIVAALALALPVLRPASGERITFALDAPAVHSVSLVGDFTEWRTDAVQLA